MYRCIHITCMRFKHLRLGILRTRRWWSPWFPAGRDHARWSARMPWNTNSMAWRESRVSSNMSLPETSPKVGFETDFETDFCFFFFNGDTASVAILIIFFPHPFALRLLQFSWWSKCILTIIMTTILLMSLVFCWVLPCTTLWISNMASRKIL